MPIRRRELLADRQAVVSLIERLESTLPALPEGVAIAERLLTDLASPLYVWAEPGMIRRLACLAVAAMDPPVEQHDRAGDGSHSAGRTAARAVARVG